MAENDQFFIEPEFRVDEQVVSNNRKLLTTAFRNHIVGKLPILIAKVMSDDETLEREVERIMNIPRLDRNSLGPKADTTDLVYKFSMINKLLLQPRPRVVVPQSSISNSFITLTETAILRQLGMQDWLKEKKDSMSRPQGSFLQNIFGRRLGGRFDALHIGKFLDFAEKNNLEGRNLAEKLNCRVAIPRKERYLLRTSFLSDGFSVKCLVTDTTKKAAPAAKESDDSFMVQAEKLTWRKKPVSDVLAEGRKTKVNKVIGVDFGETYSLEPTIELLKYL